MGGVGKNEFPLLRPNFGFERPVGPLEDCSASWPNTQPKRSPSYLNWRMGQPNDQTKLLVTASDELSEMTHPMTLRGS